MVELGWGWFVGVVRGRLEMACWNIQEACNCRSLGGEEGKSINGSDGVRCDSSAFEEK